MLKYFKFECTLCLKLTSHTLVTHCCLSPICLNCSLELADHYSCNPPPTHCLFCDLNVSQRFLIRDPSALEQKKLSQKCKDTIQKLELQKQDKGKHSRKNSKASSKGAASHRSSILDKLSKDFSPNKFVEESAVKPKRLDFLED